MIKAVYKNTTNMGTRKKEIWHLLFTITNHTRRIQKGFQLQFSYSFRSLLSGFWATLSESLQWRLVLVSTSTTCSSLYIHHGSSRLINHTHWQNIFSTPQMSFERTTRWNMNDLEAFRMFKSHPGPVMGRLHPSGGRLLRLLPTLIRYSAAGIQSHFKEKPHPFQPHILA